MFAKTFSKLCPLRKQEIKTKKGATFFSRFFTQADLRLINSFLGPLFWRIVGIVGIARVRMAFAIDVFFSGHLGIIFRNFQCIRIPH